MDEGEAFFLLCTIVEDILPNYYSKTMIGSLVDVQVFDILVQRYQPNIYKAITDVANTACFGVTWFMCLFIGCLPWDCTLRALDIIFSEGSRGLFIVGLAVLHSSKNNIFATNPDDLLFFLKTEIAESVDLKSFNSFLHFYAEIITDGDIESFRKEQTPVVLSNLKSFESLDPSISAVPDQDEEMTEYQQFESRMKLVKDTLGFDKSTSFSQTFQEETQKTIRGRARSGSNTLKVPKLRQIARSADTEIISPRVSAVRSRSGVLEEMLDFVLPNKDK